MNIDAVKKLYTSYEARIDNHGSYTRKPPYYYDSLRHAFQYYFNTFNTQNWHYEYYASRPIDLDNDRSPREYLDDENTILSIVSFQRFFELFLKSLLFRVDPRLTLHMNSKPEFKGLSSLIQLIQDQEYHESDYVGAQTVNFPNAINRFFGLINLHRKGRLIGFLEHKYSRIEASFGFLFTSEVQTSLSVLNWYRDRILHRGNKLPTMLLLDYVVTQDYAPLISQIIEAEKLELGESTFFLTTPTGINILDKLTEIKFDLEDHADPGKREELFISLLHIGHLKEMGRANLNMDHWTRDNIQARYEYNYRDPKGRGERFAIAEKAHQNFKDIKTCPCCGTISLVLYVETVEDVIFNPGKMKSIEWVTCYTCNYHIRYNVGDPNLFSLSDNSLFDPN